MTEFTVHLANRPGMLAMLTEQISAAGIHIEALAAYSVGDEGVARMMVDDASTTRAVLERADLTFDQREVLVTVLPHQASAMATMARRLANADVNIEAIYLLNSSVRGLEFAVAVDELGAAREQMATS